MKSERALLDLAKIGDSYINVKNISTIEPYGSNDCYCNIWMNNGIPIKIKKNVEETLAILKIIREEISVHSPTDEALQSK